MSDFLLRVIISDVNIQKVKLAVKPDTVTSLAEEIRRRCNIDYDFILMYVDADFHNELVSLTDMSQIDTLSSVRIVGILNTVESVETATNNSASVAVPLPASSSMRTASGWPDKFVVPQFDHDIELLLQKGNNEYNQSGQLMNLTKSVKTSILKRLASVMYDIKAYPAVSECRTVAEAIVEKFPCLREPGSQNGFDGWTNSIVFKMGNYRTEIRKAGGQEVKVNGGRKSRYSAPNGPGTNVGIKKPRRGEANYLPNASAGSEASLIDKWRTELQVEAKKVTKDLQLIHTGMEATFAARRSEIVTEKPRMTDLLSRWPTLFMPKEVTSVCYI